MAGGTEHGWAGQVSHSAASRATAAGDGNNSSRVVPAWSGVDGASSNGDAATADGEAVGANAKAAADAGASRNWQG